MGPVEERRGVDGLYGSKVERAAAAPLSLKDLPEVAACL